MPSRPFGCSLIGGVSIAAYAQRRAVRIMGALYPGVMLIVIVATGNHFFFDAAAGAVVVGIGYVVARLLTGRGTPTEDDAVVVSSAKRFEERRALAAQHPLDIAA